MTTIDDRSVVSWVASRRWWLRLVVWLVLGFIVVFALVLWMLSHLEHPWIKPRVEGLLSSVVGTELSYERLSISPLSGLEVEGLVLETPESLRAHAPELLRVDSLDIPIETGPLLGGRIVVPEVRGGAAQLSVVVTDDGRNSLGELDLSSEPDEEPPTPLSQSLQSLETLSLYVGSIHLAPIRLRIVQVVGEQVESESELAPLAIVSEGIGLAEPLRGSVAVRAADGEQVTISVLDWPPETTQQRERHARVVPNVEASLDEERTLGLFFRVGLVDQALFPELAPVSVLAHSEAYASFRPDEAQTTLELSELSVFDSMLAAHGSVTIDDQSNARIDGEGKFAMASLPWAVPWLVVDDLAGRFEVDRLQIESGLVSSGGAEFSGSLGRLRYDEDTTVFALRGADLEGVLSSPEGATRTLGLLRVDVGIETLETAERATYRAKLSGLDAKAMLRGVGTNGQGMWGLQGKGSVDGHLGSLTVDAGPRVRGRHASLDLDVDLGSRQVVGQVPVRQITVKQRGLEPVQLRRAELEVVAQEPLHWIVDDGSPSLVVDASVAKVSMGDKRLRAKDWTLRLDRTGVDTYALDSRINADRVSWGKFQYARESSLVVSAVIEAGRPAVRADASLSVAGKAETTLELHASHDSPRSRYDIEVVGREAGPILGAALFDDGGMEEDALDFAFESRGEFRGLLRKRSDGSILLSRDPLRTMRGQHSSKLRVEEASLVRDGILHELAGLTITASSTHESPGRGTLEATATLDEARYGDAGWEVVLREYQHELRAAYAALYGAPSFAIRTDGTVAEVSQPYFRQYPVEDAVFGAEVDVDATQVVAVREAYFRNPAGGTKFEARAAYEGWQGVPEEDVCEGGTEGCPQVMSMYGRQAAIVTGTLEQDFSFWKSTERTKSGGAFVLPFTVETGDLNTYRVLAQAEFRDVVLELPQYGLLVDDLDALIPIEQELATKPRFFVVPTKKGNAMSQKRFFDMYPFTKRDSFFTVDEIQFGRERIGPLAANVQVVGSTLAMDQLHAAYRSGFITGQVLGDLSVEDPKFVFRGNITGVEPADGRGVLDANVAMTFVPTTLILEGKAQVVRISKAHLFELIDAIDPYQQDEDLNRVRLALKFGYPKFVMLKLDEGLMDAKIDLGGLAGVVRIDEIKGIPVTPFIEQYVQPYIEQVMSPTAAARAMIEENEGT